MKILVTGGTGYIGSHTVVELIAKGNEILIIDNLSNSDISMLDRIEQISGTKPHFTNIDLTEKDKTLSFFDQNTDIDAIIHFAALKSVGESVNDPIAYYENNLCSLFNLMDCMKVHKIPSLVFSSSATVYGSPDKLPVTEDTPIGMTPSPYGATKQMGERMIDDFCKVNTWLSAMSLRYFNPIGAHRSGIIGELPTGTPNNLMPYITQTAAGVRTVLSVFGSDYNTEDGTAIRDYIHVSDVASAHVSAVEYLSKNRDVEHEKINIGTGRGSSVLEVIKSFEKTSGTLLNYKMADRRDGDVESVFADVSLAKKKLQWEAQNTLDDMTRSAWIWEKKLRGI